MLPLPLERWLSEPRPADTLIAWRGEQQFTLGQLRFDVAQLVMRLTALNGHRIALCFDDSYLFIVALLATLHAHKTPVIPGHSREALLHEQRANFDLLLAERLIDWGGQTLRVESVRGTTAAGFAFNHIAPDATLELFTSGSTGQPRRVIKPITCLNHETQLLADKFGTRLQGCSVAGSVVPQHMFGLTFRIMLPMSLGLPLHAPMIYYAEQLAALETQRRYLFISSPAFLKRLDEKLSAPPVAMILSAGGVLPWQCVMQSQQWLGITPDEIYGSTETGILAWRHRDEDQRPWQPFPGVTFQAEREDWRVWSPLIPQPEGWLLDDRLVIKDSGEFHLLGRKGRVVKIEEKRISLTEIERRLMALPGVTDAAAMPITRAGRQAIGALLALDNEMYLCWQQEGRKLERRWRNALQAWLEPVALPRYWRVVKRIPVNSMNKRVYPQLQELFDESA
ncbi:AMP-dependent synthetase [Enterobacterales bacterium CwR94]|nr:AMP-dependent synthetase [Enterobacterales bacterium CwR94]